MADAAASARAAAPGQRPVAPAGGAAGAGLKAAPAPSPVLPAAPGAMPHQPHDSRSPTPTPAAAGTAAAAAAPHSAAASPEPPAAPAPQPARHPSLHSSSSGSGTPEPQPPHPQQQQQQQQQQRGGLPPQQHMSAAPGAVGSQQQQQQHQAGGPFASGLRPPQPNIPSSSAPPALHPGSKPPSPFDAAAAAAAAAAALLHSGAFAAAAAAGSSLPPRPQQPYAHHSFGPAAALHPHLHPHPQPGPVPPHLQQHHSAPAMPHHTPPPYGPHGAVAIHAHHAHHAAPPGPYGAVPPGQYGSGGSAAGHYGGGGGGGTLTPGRKYYRYHMQRLQTAASHILFYLVDAVGVAHLAVVGTDVRGTGHFVYSSIPDFKEAVPLRCTNRIKVMEYLAALGAADAADPDTVQVPGITQEHLEMLLTSDPMYSMPALDRQYSSWREEGGKFADGRHYKQFIVVDDATGYERVVVTAEDSHRRDRRYTYMAVPELGGFKLENGNAVKEWLDLMVGRGGGGGLPTGGRASGVMRRAKAEAGADARAGGHRAPGPYPSHQAHSPLLPSPTDALTHHLPPGSGGGGALRAAAAAAMAAAAAAAGLSAFTPPASPGLALSTPPTSTSNKTNVSRGPPGVGSHQKVQAGQAGLVVAQQYGLTAPSWPPPGANGGASKAAAAAAAGAAAAAAAAAAAGGGDGGGDLWPGSEHSMGDLFGSGQFASDSLPWDPAHNLGVSHEADSHAMAFGLDSLDAMPAAFSPAATAAGGQQQQQQQAQTQAQQGQQGQQQQGEQHAHNDSHTDSTKVEEAVRRQADGEQAGSGGGGGSGGGMEGHQPQEQGGQTLLGRQGGQTGTPPQQQQQQSCTSQDVLDAFQGSELLGWVAGVPDAAALARFASWSERLSYVISDERDPAVPDAPPGSGPQPQQQQQEQQQRLTVQEALDILKVLEHHPVNLRLLEGTQMGMAVSKLHTHQDARVAQAAQAVTSLWRSTASQALQLAHQARQRGQADE